ncbi:MAG: hypothetical protein ABIC95_03195 [archaeon]
MKLPPILSAYRETPIETFNGVRISDPTPANPDDDRGPVYELYQGIPGQQLSVLVRKEGVVFGDHFHRGKDPSKDPEYFYFVSGTAVLSAFDRKTKTRMTAKIGPHTLVEIDPFIFHRFEAETDVVFIEYRRSLYDPADPDDGTVEEYITEPEQDPKTGESS